MRPVSESGPTGGCDCTVCSGEDVHPQQLIGEVTAGAADLLDSTDPLDAEIVGAMFLSMRGIVGEEFDDALIGGLLPAIEERATPDALATVLAIGSVAADRVAKSAATAADRLTEAGMRAPEWAAELDQPITVTDCQRFVDPAGTASVLICSFRRAARGHSFLLSVDHLDCGAATDIVLLEEDELPEALAMIQADGHEHGVTITRETVARASSAGRSNAPWTRGRRTTASSPIPAATPPPPTPSFRTTGPWQCCCAPG
jgi:hypothetical protein